jgi:hypothetical protein
VLSVPVLAADRERCATRLPSADEMSLIESAITSKKGVAVGPVNVPVWVHVIRRGKGINNGDVPDKQINAQISVLNQSFAGNTGGASSPFSFTLAGVTRTTNVNWFDNMAVDFAVEIEAKNALRRGGAETLNLYTVDGVAFLGFAYLPKTITKDKYLLLDGVVVDWRTLPGGTFAPYNEGDTATHEVGHWLGLLHTFDRGCTIRGDEVDDTPAEAAPNFVCTPGVDSCAGAKFPGTDPVTNFMDYTEDFCIYEFTRGQVARMNAAWAAFRQ